MADLAQHGNHPPTTNPATTDDHAGDDIDGDDPFAGKERS